MWEFPQARYQRERAEKAERERDALQAKYDKLVEDLRRVAMRPQYVSTDEGKPVYKARSSAEIRRMFDQENERILADKQ